MEQHSKREKIMSTILQIWESLPKSFKSEELVTRIWLIFKSEYLYPDTVLRYMRELKQQGKINYVCENRKSRVYLKI